LDALRFATVPSESGTEGSGGAVEDVEDDRVLEGDPARPTDALVAPPLVSQGFGGDGEDMRALVPARRAVVRVWLRRWRRYNLLGSGDVPSRACWRGAARLMAAKVCAGRQRCS